MHSSDGNPIFLSSHPHFLLGVHIGLILEVGKARQQQQIFFETERAS